MEFTEEILLRLYLYHNDFEKFRTELLGIDETLFDGICFCASEKNLAATAVWCAYFNREYTIAIDSKKNLKVVVGHYLSILDKNFGDSVVPKMTHYNHRSITLENNSRILFFNTNNYRSAVCGQHINSIISDKSVFSNMEFAKAVLPTLHSNHLVELRVLDVENFDLVKELEIRGINNSIVESTIIRADNDRPLLRIAVLIGGIEVYVFYRENNFDVERHVGLIEKTIKESVGYKLELLDL